MGSRHMFTTTRHGKVMHRIYGGGSVQPGTEAVSVGNVAFQVQVQNARKDRMEF